jgi:hypothetical protein
MSNDKLTWVSRAQTVQSPQRRTKDYSGGQRIAVDNAIRAQLMHVAIGFAKVPSQAVRILIDLSVYISMHDEKTLSQRRAARNVLIHGAKPHWDSPIDQSEHVWEQTGILIPYQASVCTAVRSDFTEHLRPVSGDPITLRLLFDAHSERNATDKARQLCKRFSEWHDAETSLKAAMAAIHAVIINHSVSDEAYDRLYYKSADVRKGWHAHIADPIRFLMCDALTRDVIVPRLPMEIGDYCISSVENAWHETAKKFGLFSDGRGSDLPGEPVSDLEEMTDVADDYVSAERMIGMWFGKRPRRQLR